MCAKESLSILYRFIRNLRSAPRKVVQPQVQNTVKVLEELEKEAKFKKPETQKNKPQIPKLSQKKKEYIDFSNLEDERLKYLMIFKRKLSIATEKETPWKYSYFPCSDFPQANYRCQDKFTKVSKLPVQCMKPEHLKIAEKFQSLPDWKFAKIKSDSNQIHVLASLTSDDAKQAIKSEIEPLCTSLHLVTSYKDQNGQKITKFDKGSSEFLEQQIGRICYKSGPFADAIINPPATETMFKSVNQVIKRNDIVIDFDCNAGLYAIGLARKAKRVIGLDNAQIHVENAQKNARDNQLDNYQFRLGANFKELDKIFEELHYENAKATILLHPQENKIIPSEIIRSIIDCQMVKNVLFFTSHPQSEAFEALKMFLSDSKTHQRRRFNLYSQRAFNIFPNSPYLHYVFNLASNLKIEK